MTTGGGSVLGSMLALVLAMALRRGHGTGASSPLRVEVPPPDELRNPDVAAAPVAAPSGPLPRRPGGQIDCPEAARALAERSAAARREKRARAEAFVGKLRLADDLPLFEPSQHATPFSEEAEVFFQAKCAELGRDSDGKTSTGVAAIVRSAAWQIYAGRMLFELASSKAFLFVEAKPGGKPEVNAKLMLEASRLMEAGRQSLLAAHHVQQLESEARARTKRVERPADVHAEVVASLLEDER